MTPDGDLALFDEMPYRTAEPPPPAESRDQSRVRRQREALARHLHPLSLVLTYPLLLHPGAAPVDDRAADGRRCGNCRFRELIYTNGNRKWAKCLIETWYAAPDAEPGSFLRISHGAGTDIRAWWPACTDHEWGDRLSDDAARCVPEDGPR